MIYWQLFLSFFKIGLFSIGGGYAAMPLIQSEIIDFHHWISLSEFTDLLTISQMTPGPIAINSATFVGSQIAGFAGSVTATLGCIAPSCMIVALLAVLYQRYRNLTLLQGILEGLRPAVVALIASAGVTLILAAFFKDSVIGMATLQKESVLLFLLALLGLRKLKLDPTKVMVLCGVIQVVITFLI